MKHHRIIFIGIVLSMIYWPTKAISQDESWGIGTMRVL